MTDANLMLGYYDPHFFVGGRMVLDQAAAEEALAKLGAQISLSAIETASGIHRVVTENYGGGGAHSHHREGPRPARLCDGRIWRRRPRPCGGSSAHLGRQRGRAFPGALLELWRSAESLPCSAATARSMCRTSPTARFRLRPSALVMRCCSPSAFRLRWACRSSSCRCCSVFFSPCCSTATGSIACSKARFSRHPVRGRRARPPPKRSRPATKAAASSVCSAAASRWGRSAMRCSASRRRHSAWPSSAISGR